MPALYPPELAPSDRLYSRQEGEQAEKPGDMKNDINHWLTEIGSWIPTSEPSPARRTSIDLDDNDVKPPQTTGLTPAYPSGSFDKSFESGESYQWRGHWTTDEADWWTGSDADARRSGRSVEAEIERLGRGCKTEDADSPKAIKGGTCRQSGTVQRSGVIQCLVDGQLLSSEKENNGGMLLRWSKESSEDPWHPGRDEVVLQ